METTEAVKLVAAKTTVVVKFAAVKVDSETRLKPNVGKET